MTPSQPARSPLTPVDVERLARLGQRFPLVWVSSARRRRLLFLGLAAPGFAAVFATPLHQSLALLALGLVLFAAALAFRWRTEPLFARAEAAALWPQPPSPRSKESPRHA